MTLRSTHDMQLKIETPLFFQEFKILDKTRHMYFSMAKKSISSKIIIFHQEVAKDLKDEVRLM